MIEITTKNGFTIICEGITFSADKMLSFDDTVKLYSPEIGTGIHLIMNMDTALIISENVNTHRPFNRYWDEADFNSTLDEAGKRGGGWAVILESIKLLKEYIETRCQYPNAEVSNEHTA